MKNEILSINLSNIANWQMKIKIVYFTCNAFLIASTGLDKPINEKFIT